MTLGLPLRDRLGLAVLVGLGCLALGAMLGTRPGLGIALVGLGALTALAFLAPVAHLGLLLVVTAIVPYGVQNLSAGSAGLVISDALLLTGLLRAVLVLLRQPLDRRRAVLAALCLVVLLGAAVQFVHGAMAGREISVMGAEMRELMGYGALIVALPIVADGLARERLLKMLLVVGLLLGLWGIAQWVLNIQGGNTDVGVRPGVTFTTEGRGQIQGGLYAFPVAVVLAYAALISGELRRIWTRALVIFVLALNAMSLLLTYERTFWVAAVAGMALVALHTKRIQRLQAIVWTTLGGVLALAALATMAPRELTAARERLLSIGQYGSDVSIRHRLIESRHVLEKVASAPLVGSGLGDTIHWARPYAYAPPTSRPFSHNGYLWLSWKLGIPLTLLLVVMVVLAITSRGPPAGSALYASVRHGCQGALLAVLIVCVTFPSLRILSITAVIGTLLAVCVTPRRGKQPAPA